MTLKLVVTRQRWLLGAAVRQFRLFRSFRFLNSVIFGILNMRGWGVVALEPASPLTGGLPGSVPFSTGQCPSSDLPVMVSGAAGFLAEVVQQDFPDALFHIPIR